MDKSRENMLFEDQETTMLRDQLKPVRFYLTFGEDVKVYAIYNHVELVGGLTADCDGISPSPYWKLSGVDCIQTNTYDSRFDMLLRLICLDKVEFFRNILTYGLESDFVDVDTRDGWATMFGMMFKEDFIEIKQCSGEMLPLEHECNTVVLSELEYDEIENPEDDVADEMLMAVEPCASGACNVKQYVGSWKDLRSSKYLIGMERVYHLYNRHKTRVRDAMHLKILSDRSQLIHVGGAEDSFANVVAQCGKYCVGTTLNECHEYVNIPVLSFAEGFAHVKCVPLEQDIKMEFDFVPVGRAMFRLLFLVPPASVAEYVEQHVKMKEELKFLYLCLGGKPDLEYSGYAVKPLPSVPSALKGESEDFYFQELKLPHGWRAQDFMDSVLKFVLDRGMAVKKTKYGLALEDQESRRVK